MPRRAKPEPFLASIGAKIRSLRESQGLTLEKLCYETDLRSKGHMSEIEQGVIGARLDTLRRIAFRLGVSVAELVDVPLGAPSAAERGVRYVPTPRRRKR